MRPQTKGHILYESTYMKYQEEAKPRDRRKQDLEEGN